MMNYIALFTFIFNLTLTMQAYGEAAKEPVDPTGGEQSEKSCEQHQQEIKQSCSENPTLLQNQQNRQTIDQITQGEKETSALKNNLTVGKNEVTADKKSLDQSREQCRTAAEACWGKCEAERVEHQNKGNQLASKPQTAPQAPPEFQQASRAENNRNYCKKEAEKAMEEMKKSSMDLAQLLQAIASLLQALGGEDGGSEEIADIEDPEDGDPCEGENASLLIECAGESDPIGTRASVSGSTGVGDLSGGNGQDLMGQPAQGDSDDDSGSNGGSNFPGGQFAASGGLAPFGDTPGSSVGAASNGQDKLNTDIHKGYMGGGDGGFGSFSGGGGSAARSSGSSLNPFSRTASDDGRKKLQSALDKVASAGRGPASEGTNGPFQNIWGVVTQTYKKTSPSMFHKE